MGGGGDPFVDHLNVGELCPNSYARTGSDRDASYTLDTSTDL
jgi:hypothetical protein